MKRCLISLLCTLMCSGACQATVNKKSDKVFWQAHRGGGAHDAPDNTLAAMQATWKLGGIPEADIRTTRDGVMIDLDGTLGSFGGGYVLLRQALGELWGQEPSAAELQACAGSTDWEIDRAKPRLHEVAVAREGVRTQAVVTTYRNRAEAATALSCRASPSTRSAMKWEVFAKTGFIAWVYRKCSGHAEPNRLGAAPSPSR